MSVTQADIDAAEALGLSMFDGDVEPDSIKRKWTEAFAAHRLTERALVVAWLNAQEGHPQVAEPAREATKFYASIFAERIERGEHDR